MLSNLAIDSALLPDETMQTNIIENLTDTNAPVQQAVADNVVAQHPVADNLVVQHAVTDNLDQLLSALPPTVRESLIRRDNLEDLLEIVLDLGRYPEARFPGEHITLGDRLVTAEDLAYLVQRVGEFGQDNRAGIERTLHRISAIRNRSGRIVGLTCRIGRAVYGTIDIIRDIVEGGQSILMLGRPGIGKTTKLREVARVLSTEFHKRVIVVDTSNEIAGDGDIPHPAIGDARRMQVARPELQHAVMIEAVENHMPEVIVIDEIGTEAEALAARTIAERGVQLVGTAHGNSLENLMMNPTLADLIGGIQAVTLGDEEARRRGTQKTVLERKAPPTFDCIIELMDIDRLAIHRDVASVVDRILRGENSRPEIRLRENDGEIRVVQETLPQGRSIRGVQPRMNGLRSSAEPISRERTYMPPSEAPVGAPPSSEGERGEQPGSETGEVADIRRVRGNRQGTVNIFPYGVSRSRLERAIHDLSVPAVISRDIRDAHALLTLKSHFKHDLGALKGADGIPTFVIKSNTYVQIANALRDIFQMDSQDVEEKAMQEVEDAVEHVMAENEPVELMPQGAYIRRLQHQLVDKYKLVSESVGNEPNRRLRIFKR
ncbi:MAG TPA: R3H domain-containing nucleic acid-binding protein [Armatimonadota bacterium]|nr:R3H domain-containing nucleic acid-binding protein [Armatimonadota bacterium]